MQDSAIVMGQHGVTKAAKDRYRAEDGPQGRIDLIAPGEELFHTYKGIPRAVDIAKAINEKYSVGRVVSDSGAKMIADRVIKEMKPRG